MAGTTRAPAAPRGRPLHIQAQLDHDRHRSFVVFGAIVGLTLVMAVLAYTHRAEAFPVALLVMVLASVAAFLRPAMGIYVIVFLTLIGDAVTSSWWPFTKNMSSKESILYISDQLILSPLELLLAVTLLAWLLRRIEDRAWLFVRGRLFTPIALFTFFVVLGFMWGIARGGDKRIAIFEGRALFYVLVMYVLITNLLSTRRQYVRLVLVAMVAVSVQSLFSLQFYRQLAPADRAALESLSEHSATIPMNALFILLLCAVMFKCSRWLKWTAFLLAVPTMYAYLLSQRRAAMIALFLGVFVVIAVLYQRRRRAFWFVAPTTVVLGLGFVLGTWNAGGAVGLPAQAVKSVLFPDQLSDADTSSDLYRQLENFNLYFTIQNYRPFGVGFGHKFLRPAPMPDISFFEFWEYIPHNNVLWIWLKMGFLGFCSMLFMFGRAVQLGARSIALVRSVDHVAIVLVGLTYVVMFLVFAYVDIAWDPRSTVFLGVAMALCADFVQTYDIDAEDRVTPHFELVPQGVPA